jgi:hypothetical protein
VIMLQTVARWVTESVATPGPVNSKIRLRVSVMLGASGR